MQSLAWSHQMGITTVHKIVTELCPIIWNLLSPTYLKTPSTQEWKQIAKDFFDQWNFPNCFGAVDGKHINIEAPPNSGSQYFNYKKNFSIVLMACCDANYVFKLVDIGGYGSESDGGIFRNSIFGQRLGNGNLNVPKDDFLPNTDIKIPYVIVADEAFPLKKYIMRPYPGRNLSDTKRIFNYRLSRARRIIENAFGIMVARWQILKRTIVADPKHIDEFVKAIVCLHNYCQVNSNSKYCPQGFADQGDEDNGNWRAEARSLNSVGRVSSNLSARETYAIRDKLAEYFVSAEGSVPWQVDKINEGREPTN